MTLQIRLDDCVDTVIGKQKKRDRQSFMRTTPASIARSRASNGKRVILLTLFAARPCQEPDRNTEKLRGLTGKVSDRKLVRRL